MVHQLIKRFNVASYFIIASFLMTLISLLVYLFNSLTGYLAGQGVQPIVIIASLVALILIGAGLLLSKPLKIVNDFLMVIAIGLIAVSATYFILGRIELFEEVFFNPINIPPAEQVAANASIVGIVMYFVSAILLIVSAFFEKALKD